MLRLLACSFAAALLCACGTVDTPVSGAPEQALTRPPGQESAPRAAPAGLDPGEAALAESSEVAPDADGDIIVPGMRERPVNPVPGEDPRSDFERAEHRRAWDRCVTAAQRRQEDTLGGSASPVSASPEEACRASLGMASRNAIPESWARRR